MSRFALLALLSLSMMGCVKPWNAVNTGLEAGALATVHTDELIAEAMQGDHEEAREQADQEAREALETWDACLAAENDNCGDRPTVAQFMAQYEERVAQWETATVALEGLREALIVAQAAVAVWRDTREQPGNWSVVCTGLDTARSSVVQAVEAAGVEVPEEYERMLEYIGPACNLITAAVAGD